MSCTLTVYTDNTFKELFLPTINNADYNLILERGDFSLSRDIEIKMEVVDDRWSVFAVPDEYVIIQNNENKDKVICKNQSSFKIRTYDNFEFSFVAIEGDRTIETVGKYDLANINEIKIGKSPDCDIQYSGLGLVSRVHATLTPSGGGWYINDQSLNGVFVGTQRINNSKMLKFGDCVNIYGLHIVFLDNIIAVNASYGDVNINTNKLMQTNIRTSFSAPIYPSKVPEKQFFHRSPRHLPVVHKEQIAIEPPPAPKAKNERPLWMTIGPAFTMAIPMLLGCSVAIIAMSAMNGGSGRSAFMFTGIITAISSAIIGVIWGVVNTKYARKESVKEEANRFEKYSDYIVKIADDLKQKYQENTAAYYAMYPSAEEVCNYAGTPQLWSRNATHTDFLYHRIGIGDRPFEVEIAAQEVKFSLIDDELAQRPHLLKESYQVLKNVPVGIDLKDNHLIGVVGDNKRLNAIQVARSLAVQIAANNCYTDVKMAFVYDGANRTTANEWRFAKWLPHVWSEDKKSRYIATNKTEVGDVFYELAKVIRSRAEDDTPRLKDDKTTPKPYYILFVEDSKLLEGELMAKYIFNAQDHYGLTTILLDESYENLPNACEYVVENSSNYVGYYKMEGGRQNGHPITADNISNRMAEQFARSLLGFEVMEIETGGEIPNTVTFFDMYNITSLEQFRVLERWRKNRTYDSMKALIGKKAGNSDCYLDIHEKYHGPHGLIAGTTGSGKSETLQTYMLSLAINFSPEDVAFFVIDFKGGGMANLFNGLPHMAGQISNLSGNQVRRAMLSIKSENLRRQRIFGEFGVNHINSYTRLLKNHEATIPIPHLFIIIDEFAELKREEPEFMRELISVAQVGRSLGVHLILATQKPSGTVDDNIWSNSKFRLCLRVQDRQDSFDMLHRHDAAYLTNSGRCFLQVGNDEIFELFQSGWSGAVYDENMSNRSDIATMLALNGKAAIVGNRIKFKQKENARVKFLSILSAHLFNAKAQLKISDEEVLNNPIARDEIVEKAFEYIEPSELDYPYSKYNAQRLEEFLVLLVQRFDGNLDNTVREITSGAGKFGGKLPEFKDKTQLDAVVEYLASVADKNNYKNDIMLWMPVLEENIYLDSLDGYVKYAGKWSQNTKDYNLDVVIGLCDDPENQNQFPISLNFAENGNHAVCGSVVSGKSTFIQSAIFALINKYSPEQVNIYALDFSSRLLGAFENSVHVGGVMYENDLEKIGKFFNMIEKELDNRKTLLGGGNYSQYVKIHGVEIPSIVIAVDNYANFREKTNTAYDDIMLRISRDGVNYGIYLLVSSAGFGTSEIPNRMGDNIRTVFCLEMGDKFKYADVLHTMRIDILPEADIKGRGLASVGTSILEFQTALSLEANDDYDRMEKIKAVCEDMKASWNGRSARPIPEIPSHPVLSEFIEEADYNTLIKRDMLPFGYNEKDASLYSVNLASTYFYLITGKARSGKTNCLKSVIAAASKAGGRLSVIDYSGEELMADANKYGAKYLTNAKDIFDFWNELIPTFKERNKKKRDLLSQGFDDEEIFEKMQSEEKIFIFIDDVCAFVKAAYNAEGSIAPTNGFLENILEKGYLHNIFFIGCLDTDAAAGASIHNLYNIIVSYKTGVHFGGNVFKQKIFDFSNLSFNEQNKSYKAGIGLSATADGESVTKIVVPDARR
ncbi:MAG: type VII secretion protein EssC [Eubacterium sp.]|nr:type VII secretion protein EssC [Eubacterium sp.]